jgi:sugar-specific transcriptional regulator TrmB
VTMRKKYQIYLEEICSQLVACGFKEYSAKIYVTLSSLGMAKVTELHAITKIPRSKIYSSLIELEKDEFVTTFGTNPIYYVALDGTAAHLKILEREREINDILQLCFKKLKEINQFSVYNGFMHFRTNHAISSQVEFRLERCKRDVLIVCNDAVTLHRYAAIIQKTSKRIPVYLVTIDDDVSKTSPLKCYTTTDSSQRDLMHMTYNIGRTEIPFAIYFYLDRISTFGILKTEKSFAISNESDIHADFVVKHFLRTMIHYSVSS